MGFGVCLCLLLFIATGLAVEDNFTMVALSSSPTALVNSTTRHISATSTPLSTSATASDTFTINPYNFSSTFMPSHTIKPTITPPPPTRNTSCYSVNSTDSPCVLLCLNNASQPIRLISNFTGEKGSAYNVTVLIPGPSHVKVSGFCPKSINSNIDRSGLYLSWSVSSVIKYELNLTFVLNQKPRVGSPGDSLGGQDVWFLETATYLSHNVSDATYFVNLTNETETETIASNVRRAYTCDKPRLFFFQNTNSKNRTVTIMNITEYTLQPFALNLTRHKFLFLDTCEPGGIPLFVPIIVAGILTAFVCILLLLYVIGRFRTRKKVQYERLS